MSNASKIADEAIKMEGTQYWSEACAHAVSACLRNAGLEALLPANSDWVPSWAGWGSKVSDPLLLQPGDLVIYNWSGRPPDPHNGGGGYDHIGVYVGKGQAVNVSSANGHKFVATQVTAFQEGRRDG